MDSPSRVYYPYFDYLRIILASVVMFGHDGLISWEHSGKLAVDIFFALSGWLIGGILIKTDLNKLPRFYFNRTVRIWVPYYIALSLIIIASLLKDPIDHKWIEFILYKITWVYNLFGPPQLQACKECMPLDGTGHHFWSVNAEEQFYLLAPLLLVVFARAARQLITWCIIVSVLWFLGAYAPIAFGVFLFNWVLGHFDLRESDLRHIFSAAFLFWYIERRVLGIRDKIYTIKRGQMFSITAYILIISGLAFGLILYPSIYIASLLTLFLITAYIISAKVKVVK